MYPTQKTKYAKHPYLTSDTKYLKTNPSTWHHRHTIYNTLPTPIIFFYWTLILCHHQRHGRCTYHLKQAQGLNIFMTLSFIFFLIISLTSHKQWCMGPTPTPFSLSFTWGIQFIYLLPDISNKACWWQLGLPRSDNFHTSLNPQQSSTTGLN